MLRTISVVSVLFFVAAACSATPISPRILGGQDADIADFPYIGSIELNGYGHSCGAVIIDARWALTDAWCTFRPVEVTRFSLRVGSARLGNGTQHAVVQWIHHPLAEVYNEINDFALIQVDPPFEFGDNVQAVPLAEAEEATPDGADAVVAGWGQANMSLDTTNEDLQFASLTVLGDTDCSSLMGSYYHNSMLCATDFKSQVVSCSYDEGGPLLVNGKLFGIAQWPGACEIPEEVQIYGRVASVRDWIDSTIAA